MSDKDIKLIWEAYSQPNYNRDFKLLVKIQKEWDEVILPQLPDVDTDEFDDKYDENDNLLVITPLVHLVYEQELDPDMDLQVERIEQDFKHSFGRYDFISFSVEVAEDYGGNDYSSWVGINVVIKELEVPANMIQEYFRIVLAVNNKVKELSRD